MECEIWRYEIQSIFSTVVYSWLHSSGLYKQTDMYVYIWIYCVQMVVTAVLHGAPHNMYRYTMYVRIYICRYGKNREAHSGNSVVQSESSTRRVG